MGSAKFASAFTIQACESYASFQHSRGKGKRGRGLGRKMGLGIGRGGGEEPSDMAYSALKS